jgi:hypothetical protein
VSRWVTIVALCAAVLVAGCGDSGDKKTIPRADAAKLIETLQEARIAAGDQDRCDKLSRLVAQLQTEVRALPASVDTDTRESLVQGVDNLESHARSECSGTETNTTETTETTPPTTTETVPPTTTETAPPTTTETVPPPTTTETQPPTQTQPPEPTVPPNGGTPEPPGNGNGNGNGNGGGVGFESAPGQRKGHDKPGKKPKPPKHGKGPKGGHH